MSKDFQGPFVLIEYLSTACGITDSLFCFPSEKYVRICVNINTTYMQHSKYCIINTDTYLAKHEEMDLLRIP